MPAEKEPNSTQFRIKKESFQKEIESNCYACGKPVNINDNNVIIRFKGNIYHEDCFINSSASKSIEHYKRRLETPIAVIGEKKDGRNIVIFKNDDGKVTESTLYKGDKTLFKIWNKDPRKNK